MIIQQKSDNLHNNEEWKMTATELSSYIKEEGIRLYEPTKSGKTFKGWQIIYNNEVQNGLSVKTLRIDPLGDITLKSFMGLKRVGKILLLFSTYNSFTVLNVYPS